MLGLNALRKHKLVNVNACNIHALTLTSGLYALDCDAVLLAVSRETDSCSPWPPVPPGRSDSGGHQLELQPGLQRGRLSARVQLPAPRPRGLQDLPGIQLQVCAWAPQGGGVGWGVLMMVMVMMMVVVMIQLQVCPWASQGRDSDDDGDDDGDDSASGLWTCN